MWRSSAACRGLDPEIFYPSTGDMDGLAKAISICNQCDVKKECLDSNITESIGVFGGTSAAERKRIRASYDVVMSCRLCGSSYIRTFPSQVFCDNNCRSESRRMSRRRYDLSR